MGNIFSQLDTILIEKRTHLTMFHQLCQHDDNVGVHLPHHSPEILHRLGQRSLCRDVSSPVTIAVNVAGVDVVRALDAANQLQGDPRVLVGQREQDSILALVARQLTRRELGPRQPKLREFLEDNEDNEERM